MVSFSLLGEAAEDEKGEGVVGYHMSISLLLAPAEFDTVACKIGFPSRSVPTLCPIRLGAISKSKILDHV
jgi:hypothetical protein